MVKAEDGTSKDKKYANLSSNILGNEGGGKPTYDKDAKKAEFGASADWKSMGGKMNNRAHKIDTYTKKQQNLASSVFEGTDYSHFAPMNKKTHDINNLTDNKRKKDHMYSDILGQTSQGGRGSPIRKKNDDLASSSGNWSNTADVKSQIKKDYTSYSSKTQKHSQLRSALDTHTFEQPPPPPPAEPVQGAPTVLGCKKSMAVKVQDLASDIHGTGSATASYKNNDHTKNNIVDFDLKDLPQNVTVEELKKIAKVKHVISAQLDEDSIRNVCTGTGRVKLRLAPDEDQEAVKLRYLSAGYGI